MKKLIVCKFGGTSLANVENIKKVCAIIKSDPRRRIIVVSAPGKRDINDTKITDTLFDIFYRKERGDAFDAPYEEFRKRFHEIEADFGLTTNLDEIMNEFYTEIPKGNVDYMTSTGEYFMAKVMAAILGFAFCDLDKSHAICFDNNGQIDLELSRKNFAPWKDKKVVVPGFYGTMPNGAIKILPRGGSDITGAIIANIADADIYENWTDVDGVYDRDPAKHVDAKIFETITYDEVEALARAGANVLHPDCIKYVRDKKIPINLRNTFNPMGQGTIIKN